MRVAEVEFCLLNEVEPEYSSTVFTNEPANTSQNTPIAAHDFESCRSYEQFRIALRTFFRYIGRTICSQLMTVAKVEFCLLNEVEPEYSSTVFNEEPDCAAYNTDGFDTQEARHA